MIRLAVLALLAAWPAARPVWGQAAFDTPAADQALTAPGPGGDKARTLTIHCATYKTFMVRDVHEGDDIGTMSVSVAPPGGPCTAAKAAAAKELPGFGSMEVAGALGRFLVLMWPDGANGATSFAVFDTATARKLYSDVVKLDGFKRLALVSGGDALEMRFVRVLALPCSVVAGGAACWSRAAKDLKLPGEIAKRAAPIAACAAAYAQAGGAMKPDAAEPSVVAYEAALTIAAMGAVTVASRGELGCWAAS